MAAERLGVPHVRDVLRLHFEEKKSQSEIARSVGCGKTTVREYLHRAKSAKFIDYSSVVLLDDETLETRLGFKRPPPAGLGSAALRKLPEAIPDWSQVNREMSRPHVTLSLLWTEYRESRAGCATYGYTQFCEHYRRFTKKLSVVMRQTHKAGEKGFVDYSDGLWLVDPSTGEKRKTQLFVGALGASSYTFAEASLGQTAREWVTSHVRMYEFFGGVPFVTVPDNLRAGVSSASFYEPRINESYQEMANHYGTCVLPARVRRPRDKAKAEAAVLVAQRWILARLRDRLFTTLAEMNEAIAECLVLLNERRMRHVNKSRVELFLELDRPALKLLPAVRFEYADWKQARVNIDYHVAFEDHFYSVSYTLAHALVMIRATATTIEIFLKGKRVASHLRSSKKGRYSTKPEHMPAHHRAHAEWSPSRVISWAGSIGINTKRLVEKILETKRHPEQGYRAALGIIRLEKKYGRARLEKASAKALEVGAHSFRFVNEMLKNKMDQPDLQMNAEPIGVAVDPQTGEEQLPLELLGQENIRGGEYYH